MHTFPCIVAQVGRKQVKLVFSWIFASFFLSNCSLHPVLDVHFFCSKHDLPKTFVYTDSDFHWPTVLDERRTQSGHKIRKGILLWSFFILLPSTPLKIFRKKYRSRMAGSLDRPNIFLGFFLLPATCYLPIRNVTTARNFYQSFFSQLGTCL